MYTYSNNLGEEFTFENLSDLEEILKKPYQNWKEGSGDSSIDIGSDERLIFFKLEQGIFIMYMPDYISPKINADNSIEIFSHYVGGEEMKISNINLCDEPTALNIFKVFIEENGKLNDDFEWVDYYQESI